MGLLVDGQWQEQAHDTSKTKGHFVRQEQAFRHWVTADGAAGPSGDSGFKAQADRYHLYVGLACPWAHRTLIMRALKNLEAAISVSAVHWHMGERGWPFSFDGQEQGVGDPLHGMDHLYELYQKADGSFTGRVTVPILWDKQTDTIVNNESSEIIRMLNTEFAQVGANDQDFYPAAKRPQIDAINERVYDTLNNGVYKSGFASTQEAYESAVVPLFDTLDWLEDKLSNSRYLTGDKITEADIRLFPTLVRFDAVYVGHFKCNLRRLIDYPNLWGYTRDLYQQPQIGATVNFEHIKKHYYKSHETINPHRVVPLGPVLDFDAPHGRG